MTQTYSFLRRATLAAALGAACGVACAQTALRLVIPFGSGTTTDIAARHVGDAMAAALGQTLVAPSAATSSPRRPATAARW